MEQHHEPEPKHRSRTAPILAAVAAIFFVVFLVIPGYIAGWYCKLTDDYTPMSIMAGGEVFPSSWQAGPGIGMQIFLAPAMLATKIAPPLQEIYWKQFTAAATPRSK